MEATLNQVPLGDEGFAHESAGIFAPGKTDMHGLIMGSNKDICSLFDSYIPNHEASMHEITWRMFSTQLWSTSKKNKIKRSSYVTGMPLTNQVSFSSREFRPPEKLEMANLCSHEPTTNSIIPKGVVKVLKDVSKSGNNLEDLKDFSDSLPIFDKYDEELMEIWIACEDECDLPSPKLDLMFDIDNEETNGLTCFEPEHPSSRVLVSQVLEEEPLDYPHQGPRLDTRRPLDDGLGPIFDEEDELGPTFDEKAPSMTSINIENHLCFDPGTTPTPLSNEHCKELCIISSVSDLFDKVCSNDIKRSSLDHLEKHVLEMIYGSSCLENILIYNTFFDKHAEPWIRNSQFELTLLCSKSEKLAHVLNLFFSNCAITCPDTILMYNTYFERLHNDLKPVLHVLANETLVSDLNKHLSCTYDPDMLMLVLSVQDKQDQSARGKMELGSNPFQEGGNDVPLGIALGKTDIHGLIMGSKHFSFLDEVISE
uniref:Uncharacterized protein n=1 Tax=Brassica oleracea var. oleracea TaxID=109376 RepID=A0A0D3D4G3_BRAOL